MELLPAQLTRTFSVHGPFCVMWLNSQKEKCAKPSQKGTNSSTLPLMNQALHHLHRMNLVFCDVGLHLYHLNNINADMHLFKMNFSPIFNKYWEWIAHTQPYLNLICPGGFATHSAKQHRSRALKFTTQTISITKLEYMWTCGRSSSLMLYEQFL